MRIGLLGSGMIGGTLATLLTRANHKVKVGGRDPKKLAKLAHEIEEGVETGSLNDAVAFGEIVILALPWQSAVLEGVMPDGLLFTGKIVVDAMNPYQLNGGGTHQTGALASSERVAALLPRAFLVKAFNTIYWLHLRDQAQIGAPTGPRRAIFIAGDDARSKTQVAHLIDELGFAPIDTGDLHGSTIQEPGSPLYNIDLTSEAANLLLQSVRPTTVHL